MTHSGYLEEERDWR